MISTHILDTSLGLPAPGVNVVLEKRTGGNWGILSKDTTNSDGRITFANRQETGTYRLIFEVEPYFQSRQISSFFTEIPVVFSISDTNRKYHVPLLLNPFGYSTYRGS